MQLKEDFLHYVWQYRLFTRLDIRCKDGQPLKIIDQGLKNTNAGPDFTMVKLRIGPQLWVGNVEIHIKSSDWFLHGHQSDSSYDTVVLHAVYDDDATILRTDGTVIPVLLLKDLLPKLLLSNYLRLIGGRSRFPCSRQLKNADRLIIDQVLEQMTAERFIGKAAEVLEKLQHNRNDWNETCYYLLLRNFGFKINSVPFELLADALPNTLISRYRDQPVQIAALLFGVAGFLDRDFTDAYPKKLKTEFLFLRRKHQLKTLDRSLWKFLRIHPQNFPVLRIAQAAALLGGMHAFFSAVLECLPLKNLMEIFSGFSVNPYWTNHSDFDRPRKSTVTKLGKHSAENIVINTVCVILYTYGRYSGYPLFIQRAFELLKAIPAEKNALLSGYQQAGLKLRHAYDSQAVLHLNKKFCSQKKCLDCMIGINLLGEKK